MISRVLKIILIFLPAKGEGIVRKGVCSIILRLVNMGLGFLIAILLARMLGASGYGEYSFAFAIVSILTILAQCGLPALLVRETAKARMKRNYEYIKGLWIWSLKVALALSALYGALSFIIVISFYEFLSWDFEVELPAHFLLSAILLIPVLVTSALRGGRIVDWEW